MNCGIKSENNKITIHLWYRWIPCVSHPRYLLKHSFDEEPLSQLWGHILKGMSNINVWTWVSNTCTVKVEQLILYLSGWCMINLPSFETMPYLEGKRSGGKAIRWTKQCEGKPIPNLGFVSNNPDPLCNHHHDLRFAGFSSKFFCLAGF